LFSSTLLLGAQCTVGTGWVLTKPCFLENTRSPSGRWVDGVLLLLNHDESHVYCFLMKYLWSLTPKSSFMYVLCSSSQRIHDIGSVHSVFGVRDPYTDWICIRIRIGSVSGSGLDRCLDQYSAINAGSGSRSN
jgi:hypothetical protein